MDNYNKIIKEGAEQLIDPIVPGQDFFMRVLFPPDRYEIVSQTEWFKTLKERYVIDKGIHEPDYYKEQPPIAFTTPDKPYENIGIGEFQVGKKQPEPTTMGSYNQLRKFAFEYKYLTDEIKSRVSRKWKDRGASENPDKWYWLKEEVMWVWLALSDHEWDKEKEIKARIKREIKNYILNEILPKYKWEKEQKEEKETFEEGFVGSYKYLKKKAEKLIPIGDCINNPFRDADILSEIIDTAKEITKKEFLSKCDVNDDIIKDMKEYPDDYEYYEHNGICFFTHSAIEYFYMSPELYEEWEKHSSYNQIKKKANIESIISKSQKEVGEDIYLDLREKNWLLDNIPMNVYKQDKSKAKEIIKDDGKMYLTFNSKGEGEVKRIAKEDIIENKIPAQSFVQAGILPIEIAIIVTPEGYSTRPLWQADRLPIE